MSVIWCDDLVGQDFVEYHPNNKPVLKFNRWFLGLAVVALMIDAAIIWGAFELAVRYL